MKLREELYGGDEEGREQKGCREGTVGMTEEDTHREQKGWREGRGQHNRARYV